MSFTCEFCERKMSSRSSLNLHKRTAKYCLKIQNNDDAISYFKCIYCKNSLSSKQNLTIHQESCKERIIILEEKNINLIKEIKKLKEINNKLIVQNEVYEKIINLKHKQ